MPSDYFKIDYTVEKRHDHDHWVLEELNFPRYAGPNEWMNEAHDLVCHEGGIDPGGYAGFVLFTMLKAAFALGQAEVLVPEIEDEPRLESELISEGRELIFNKPPTTMGEQVAIDMMRNAWDVTSGIFEAALRQMYLQAAHDGSVFEDSAAGALRTEMLDLARLYADLRDHFARQLEHL